MNNKDTAALIWQALVRPIMPTLAQHKRTMFHRLVMQATETGKAGDLLDFVDAVEDYYQTPIKRLL